MIQFHCILVKIDGEDVVHIEAKERNHVSSTNFSMPKSPAELVLDLELTLNQLVKNVEFYQKDLNDASSQR